MQVCVKRKSTPFVEVEVEVIFTALGEKKNNFVRLKIDLAVSEVPSSLRETYCP